ncbi:MAG: protein TolQ [Holosporales bacterium]|nr:protein TolQ [Holosporales bacterium]
MSLLYAIGEKTSNAAAEVAMTVTSAPQSLSVWGLFGKAELTIQIIMLGLLMASIWSWAIIIDKTRRLKRLDAAANAFEEMFWSSGSLDALYEKINNRPTDPLMAMFCAAMREWKHALSKGVRRNQGGGSTQWGLEQRIDRVMQLVINREISALERHTGFLASLGSNGMIIGLFGTVLGIMHSFQPIAMQQSASLAVVAPGIAEALLATAIGLIAAIPAAISYNSISSDLNRYANRLDAFASEFNAIVSRQLED